MELSYAMSGYETLCHYIEEAGLHTTFDYKNVKERFREKPVVTDEDKELDDLIVAMRSDVYLNLADLTYCEKEKYWKEVSISLYWWVADKIIKDVYRLKKSKSVRVNYSIFSYVHQSL